MTFTRVLAYETGNGDKTAALKKTFEFMLSDKAQSQAPELGYVSLPKGVVEKSLAAVEKISESSSPDQNQNKKGAPMGPLFHG